MMFREGCILCFAAPGQPSPHDGDHLIRPVYGGRASCPLDECDDPELLVEMVWVSLEAALEDAGWPLPDQTTLADEVGSTLPSLLPSIIGYATPRPAMSLFHAGHEIQWERRLEEHLETDATTCDVVCTVTGPLEPVAA